MWEAEHFPSHCYEHSGLFMYFTAKCGSKRRWLHSFSHTHTHASTITQRLPGDCIICAPWTLLRVLWGVLWVCGACLLHGVRLEWCRVFTANWCIVWSAAIYSTHPYYLHTPAVAQLYWYIYWVPTISSIYHLHCNNIHKLVQIHILTLPGSHASTYWSQRESALALG